MNTVHLVCNAHLDPVWQWEWEEGAGEAVSTFRIAAQLCEEFDTFVFNHNEAILYKWVEEYDPALFKRIQALVRQGRWHIMGGWYLQPDCNMPDGESFVRQILRGKSYFNEKFGVGPVTAINFDPFGHTRGLVQILKKSGYDSYLFCRPSQGDCPLASDDFVWVGYDGSEIIGHRSVEFYNSLKGKAGEKVKTWLNTFRDKPASLILWGIGNHGGGPSRTDLQNLNALIEEVKGQEIIHSTPENYFKALSDMKSQLPRHAGDLNAWAPACYTSQTRIKQKHRQLENELYLTEKIMSAAAIQGYGDYADRDMDQACEDLLTSEFHDIIAGTCVQSVEENSLRLMDHGLEILSRLKARAFFAMTAGQKKAEEGEIPILVYNPHPYKVTGIFECELQLADQNWEDSFSFPEVYREGKLLPCQAEKEFGNVNLDWRKKTAFLAELEPGQMNRFDCRIKKLPSKPLPAVKEEKGFIVFTTPDLEVIINCRTGLMDRLRVKGFDYVKENACLPLVLEGNDDPWEMNGDRFRQVEGKFQLMSREAGTRFSGLKGKVLDSVRVIEDGNVRTIIEAVFSYGDSFLCQRYKLPKTGTEIELEVRVHWNEKSKMLKLAIPTHLNTAKYLGQVAYGVEELPADGKEAVAHKWVGAFSPDTGCAFTCINDGIYGSDFADGEIRLSLLRSAGYAGHPIMDRPVMPQDRYSPRIDQGERLFRFWLNAGEYRERVEKINREALIHNEKPYVLPYFPSGEGEKPKTALWLEDSCIQLNAFKKAEGEDTYILRLFEPTGQERSTILHLPVWGICRTLHFSAFEIKTLKVNIQENTLMETDLMEKPLGQV